MQFADVTLYGNLTRDARVFTAGANSTPGAEFDVAVNRPYRQEGEQKNEVTYVPVTVFGKIIDSISQYLTKGKPVIIRGRLAQDKWTAEDGSPRSRHKVIVSPYGGSVELLPSNTRNDGGNPDNEPAMDENAPPVGAATNDEDPF